MAFTQAQLDALERAMALGGRTVKYRDPSGDREVTYRSLAEMDALRRRMRADLGLDTSGGDLSIRYLTPHKGL